MNPVTYNLSQFTSSGGNIFNDSLDNSIAAVPSIGSEYLFSVFSEQADPANSQVILYFSNALSVGQINDLNAVVAAYDGIPGYTGQPGNYELANVPLRGFRPGDLIWVIDGRKVGEGSGNGSGVPAYWAISNEWLVYSTDTAVQA